MFKKISNLETVLPPPSPMIRQNIVEAAAQPAEAAFLHIFIHHIKVSVTILTPGSAGDLFTGVLPNGYSPPRGFCFDLLCGDDPIMDDPSLHDYNKDKMVKSAFYYL